MPSGWMCVQCEILNRLIQLNFGVFAKNYSHRMSLLAALDSTGSACHYEGWPPESLLRWTFSGRRTGASESGEELGSVYRTPHGYFRLRCQVEPSQPWRCPRHRPAGADGITGGPTSDGDAAERTRSGCFVPQIYLNVYWRNRFLPYPIFRTSVLRSSSGVTRHIQRISSTIKHPVEWVSARRPSWA